jgi:carbonic anhydrase/acetyltransferase-like protein (isoleucine patch superfamily)
MDLADPIRAALVATLVSGCASLASAQTAVNAWGQHTPQTSRATTARQLGPTRAGISTQLDRSAPVPRVDPLAWLDPEASVVGNIVIGAHTYVGALASVRADGGRAIRIGAQSNVQETAALHAGAPPAGSEAPTDPTTDSYTVNGEPWSIWVGERSSIAPQAQLHAPVWLEDGVYVGMQALVFRAHVGAGCVIEPGARVIGVEIPAGRYVPAGRTITTQAEVDALPEITFSYGLRDLNERSVRGHVALVEAQLTGAPAAPHR